MAYNETPTDWTAMLRNREARIKIVKTNKKDDDNDIVMDDLLNADSVNRIEDAANRLIKRAAIAAVVVVTAIKVADTLGEIAVKKTKSADQK